MNRLHAHLAMWHVPEAFSEDLQPRGVERSHRLRQVPEGAGVVQVQAAAGVVRKNPGKHRPLCEVVE